MMRRARLLAILTIGGLAFAGSVLAQSRAENLTLGTMIYNRDCALCHDNSEHMLNDNGPALFGVVGRRVGSVEGYDYSPALKAANAKGNHWSSSRLDKFLTNPETMYSGTSMPMNFDDPRMRKAIVTYLKTLKAGS